MMPEGTPISLVDLPGFRIILVAGAWQSQTVPCYASGNRQHDARWLSRRLAKNRCPTGIVDMSRSTPPRRNRPRQDRSAASGGCNPGGGVPLFPSGQQPVFTKRASHGRCRRSSAGRGGGIQRRRHNTRSDRPGQARRTIPPRTDQLIVHSRTKRPTQTADW